MIRRRSPLTLAAAIFILALLPRLPFLGDYLTPDERLWAMRTVQFLQALQTGNWADTLTSSHPGVTVTWAGSLGVGLKWLLDPPADTASLAELTTALATEPNRLDMIAWLRLPIVLATTLGIVLIFILSRRLLGVQTALLAAALLALDPFFLAHSRVLQMDALLTTFTVIAWLALLLSTKTGRRRWLVLAGVASGLGLLTKSPALIIGPLMLAWVVANHWRERSSPAAALSASFVDLLCIGLPAALTMLLLWPALWVAPLATLQRLWQFSLALGGTGHELSNFWLGQPTDTPGMLFYPAVLLWRTTPVTLLGLALALVFALKRPWQPNQRRWLLALLPFALWFGLIMSLGDKKFDRYLLPVFPVLSILAAWGIVNFELRMQNAEFGTLAPARSAGVRNAEFRIKSRRFSIRNSKFVILTSLVLVQAWFALSNLPSYLTAYNPLAGGIRTARQIMLVGWGEGLEEAAAFLNQQPAAGQSRVAAWYGHNVFGPFYQGQSYDLFYDLPTAADLYANDIDYVVTYSNQLQRNLLDDSIRSRLEIPIMSSYRRITPLAQVYRWPKPFAHTTERELAPGLRLLGWTATRPGAGHLSIQLYWDAS